MGIPVMGHVGLTPQSVHQMSGYKIQGKTSKDAQKIIDDALAVEEAGAFSVVLECIPEDLAQKITDKLSIPTVGIGSGQPSRLDSCQIAINKMKKFNLQNDNLVAASDAFFPFVDGIEKLVQSGVRAVVQPSGSIRDKEIINFANETDTVLVFSKTRHFRH